MKTDAKDALHLARLLRLDEISSVALPTVEQQAARDLTRAREDCRGDLMRARHRLSKLLLRHGIVYYGGAAWTPAEYSSGSHRTLGPINRRLHQRWAGFLDPRKRDTGANVATARELAGWCWSLATLEQP